MSKVDAINVALYADPVDLDVSNARSDFDELRAAHDRLKKEHGEITAPT